MISSIKGEY